MKAPSEIPKAICNAGILPRRISDLRRDMAALLTIFTDIRQMTVGFIP
jgi:hypothetical protein